jgi:hypothetical protein
MTTIQPVGSARVAADRPSTATARAYRTGLAEGRAAEAVRAATAAQLLKRELSAVLGSLGDALIAKNEAAAITWYGVLTRMVSGAPLTD